MAELTAYCMDWHISRSHAFYALLVEPLKPRVDIQLTAWDEAQNNAIIEKKTSDQPLIFCQILPPVELLKRTGARLIWIPMWDNISRWTVQQWQDLPKSLRIIAFSDAVAERALAAGLPMLRLRYFKNPAEYSRTKWDRGRVLMYWNRLGLYRASFLKELCQNLEITELIFRDSVDPNLPPGASFDLPQTLGKTKVRQVSGVLAQSTYLSLLAESNIFLAPRTFEGVGMTLLEAMASGCAVFSKNAPTANEYIRHRETGYLLGNVPLRLSVGRIEQIARRRLSIFGVKTTTYPQYLADCQNWSEIAALRVQALGDNARQAQHVGYSQWQQEIPDYASFILDW